MTSDSDQDEAFHEIGRRLFAGPAEFIWAAGSLGGLPPMADIEIAFAGRSNVGKSSLVNALTGRKTLARTSNTPGRTQQLNFFRIAPATLPAFRLVDMPGYGFAAVGKDKVAAWTTLIHDYLRGRPSLARVYLLIDARHGLKDADMTVLTTLDQSAVSYQVVLTKADAVKPEVLAARLAGIQSALARRAAAHPVLLPTSARSGLGVAELRAAIARLLAERRATA